MSEAQNAELLLLEETSLPKRHSMPSPMGKKGILSSLLKSSSKTEPSSLITTTGEFFFFVGWPQKRKMDFKNLKMEI
jgi:hypothetical protein